MNRVNKPHSMVGHYRIKMCAEFMTSCLQADATLIERNSGYCLFCLIAGRSLTLIKCTPGIFHAWFCFFFFFFASQKSGERREGARIPAPPVDAASASPGSFEFLEQINPKKYFQSKKQKITIEFYVFELI